MFMWNKKPSDSFPASPTLSLNTVETQTIESMADEAVRKYDNDAEAIQYLNAEVLRRTPDLWATVMTQTYFPNYPR